MSNERVQTRADLAGLYQQQMQALAFEIRMAMQAIASNSLATLEASIAKQETLSVTLPKLAVRFRQALASPEAGQPFPDGPVEQKVVATSKTLRELNLQYAFLLKHSGRSIALLSSLCRSHTGHFPQDRRTMVKRQTWSCEG